MLNILQSLSGQSFSPRALPAGFTLIELLISIALVVMLAGAAVPLFSGLQVSSQLNESAEQTVGLLRLARVLSVERENNSSHGVFIDDNPAGPDRVVFFLGSSYAGRNPSYDRIIALDEALALTHAFSGGADEIVFSRAFGIPSATGSIGITHTTSGSRSISVNAYGAIDYE